jgi:hypothetical protein
MKNLKHFMFNVNILNSQTNSLLDARGPAQYVNDVFSLSYEESTAVEAVMSFVAGTGVRRNQTRPPQFSYFN